MKGIELPERSEDFAADPVELFFDLAYVFAFSQLVVYLIEHPDWPGVGRAALLFAMMWLPWSQFTWAANAVSGNGRTVRFLFLVATATSVPMAASVSTAFGSGGPIFAVTLSVIVLIGLATQLLGVEKGTELQRSAVRWAWPSLLALGVILVGGAVDGGAREITWLLAVGVVLAAMIAAGKGEWIVRSSHFAERHGLIVIIALGEVVVAVGVPVVRALTDGRGLTAAAVVALAGSGAFAGLMWWGYFDRTGPALEHRGQRTVDDRERGRYVRDVYTWAHAPIVAGIVVAAAGLEEMTLHPADDVRMEFRAMLFGGFALTVIGIGAAVWRAFHVVTRERVTAAALVGVVLLAGGGWSGAALIVAVDVIIIAMFAAEHARVER